MAITDIAPTQGTASTGVVDLTGVNFDLAGSSVSVILENVISKEKTEVTPTASTPTVVAFTIPNVPAGSYRVRTRIDPSG